MSGTINWLPLFYGRQYAQQNKSRIAMDYCILQSKGILVRRYHISTIKLQFKGINITIQRNFGTALPYFYSQITQRLIC